MEHSLRFFVSCFVVLVLFWNFFLFTAEQPANEIELNVMHYLDSTKLMGYELAISATEADKYAEPAHEQLPPRLLVLVPYEDMYHFASTICPLPQYNYIYVYNHYKHTCEFHTPSKIKTLRLLPQLKLQPHVPKETLIATFKTMQKRLDQPQSLFIQAKIINALSKIIVIGDLHGNYKALRKILARLHTSKMVNNDGILIPDTYLVFTGDIADRGPQGPELWRLIINLKERNATQVFLLRGNHETLELAATCDFLEQMASLTEYSLEEVKQILSLFNELPHGLFLGVAPEPHTDAYSKPYHFLFFCHGGFDPIVNLNHALIKMVKKHQQTCSDEIVSQEYPYLNPQYSGLLWTDFRANRKVQEASRIQESGRGSPMFHLYNKSAALDCFDELQSNYPAHPYKVDAMIRGHQHLPGISELASMAVCSQHDWRILSPERTEQIKPSGIYTCTASTRWLSDSFNDLQTYAVIRYKAHKSKWLIKAHSTFVTKDPAVLAFYEVADS